MADDEHALDALYRELWRCMVAADIQGLAAVLAPEFTLRHMTGMNQGLSEFLRAVGDGTLTYFDAQHDSIETYVEPGRDAVRVVGRSRVEAAVFGGGRHGWRLESELRARCEGGRWLFTDQRVSTY